jgi:predicted DNA-binding protein with PD1-like motif
MSDFRLVERGEMGRVAYARIAPNEDLVQSIEKLCVAQGFRNAFVRGALGSLVDACLEDAAGTPRVIRGPAIEIVSLAGEVRASSRRVARAAISGVVADTEGRLFGGPFVAGANSVCVTFEITLEEWLPSTAIV